MLRSLSILAPFVYLSSLIHSSVQSTHDINRRSAIARAAMQSLDNQIWRSRVSTSTKLKLYNTCILPIFLYGSNCWAVSKTDASKIDAFDQWCLRMLLGIKWHQFIRKDEVRITTGQSSHIAWPFLGTLRVRTITQMPRGSCQLSLQRTGGRGRPRITWLSTIQQDLRSHNLTLPDAMDMAQTGLCGGFFLVDVRRYATLSGIPETTTAAAALDIKVFKDRQVLRRLLKVLRMSKWQIF